jgi:hypothetical protein
LEVVARDQTRYDADMEATLRTERAHWDSALAEGQMQHMVEESHHHNRDVIITAAERTMRLQDATIARCRGSG